MNSPALNLPNLEASSMKLWAEFLASYFNGDADGHTLNGVTGVKFPRAKLLFQRGDAPKDGLILHVTTINTGKVRTLAKAGTGWRGRARVTWTIFVKCLVKDSAEGHNSEGLCRLGSDRLFALLQDRAATVPMANKGIMAIRPETPQIVTSNDWAVRSISVRANLLFDIN